MAQTLLFNTELNRYESVPSIEAQKLFGLPNYEIPLNDPNGELITTPYANAKQLLSQNSGYTQPNREQLLGLLKSSVYNTPEEKLKGFGESLARGFLPFDLGTQGLIALGDNPEEMRNRELYQSGVSKFIGEGLGLAGSSLIPFGQARVMSKAGQLGLKALGLASKEGPALSLGQKLTRGAIGEALEFGLLGAGEGIHDLVIKDPQATTENALLSIGDKVFDSAVTGALFGAGKPLIAAPFKAVKDLALKETLHKVVNDSDPEKLAHVPQVSPLLKRMLHVLGGPTVEQQEKYIENAKLINASDAEGFSQVYEFLKDYISQIYRDEAENKISYKQARDKLKDIEKEIKSDFLSTSKDKDIAYAQWQNIYSQAKVDAAKTIREDALAQDKVITQAIQDIKQQAFDRSQEAMDVLIESGAPVSLKPVADLMREHIDMRRSQESNLAHQIADYVEQHLERIEASGEDISAERAKKVLQGIGQEAYTKGARSPLEGELQSFYRQLYHDFKTVLENKFESYAEKIKPAAELMAIINRLDDLGYKDVDTIRNKIGKLIANKGDRATVELPVLEKVEQNSNQNFIEPLKAYVNTLKNPELLKSAEYQRMLSAANIAADFEKIDIKDFLSKLDNTENAQALESLLNDVKYSPDVKNHLLSNIDKSAYFQTKEEIKQANQALMDSVLKKQELKGLSPDNVQAFLQRAMKGKDIKTRETLNKLPTMNEKTLNKILEVIKARDDFEKGFMHGSRNVNLWRALIMSAIGAKFGGPLGAVTGAAIDRYGPQITKNILDKYIDMFEGVATGSKDPSIMRLMTYKVLSGNAPVNAEGFRAGVNYIDHAARGVKTVTRKVETLFDSAPAKKAVLDLKAEDEKRKRFENKISKLDARQMLEAENTLAHYMPEHASSLVSAMANVGTYLKQNFPNGPTIAGKPQVSNIERARYNRTVDIARNPLIVLDHLNHGTLIPKDVQDISAMYPQVFKQIQKSLLDKVIDLKLKNHNLTMSQKMGLSLMLGAPIDKSLSPSGIMSRQMPLKMPQVNPSAGALKTLKKLPGLEQTLGQRAESY